MVHSLITFAETAVMLIAFCIVGVCIPGQGEVATVTDSGIYLSVPWLYGGLALGDFALGDPTVEYHERSHQEQHDILGLAYWPLVGIPSLISAVTSTIEEHDGRWYERWATELGSQ